MKSRNLVAGLGIALLGSQLLACADGAVAEEECLPGDIDCADPTGSGGKEDAFGGVNDPAVMSQRLNYRLAELPKKGKRTKPAWAETHPQAVGKASVAWADTYWPTLEGGHNNRYQGKNEKSPIEKYDAAFNNVAGCATQPDSTHGDGAKAAWDTYKTCAGPATKWQITTFQNSGVINDGKDNDSDGKIDLPNPDTGEVDGMASWWGTCHAWAPASIMMPEPQFPVTHNGVTFQPGDIKALLQNIWDSSSAIMLGGRCNAKEIKHDPTISQNDPCADLNPGALHVVLTNFLGINNLPLVEDRTQNFEIWNQAVMGYEVTKQAKITASAANKCVGTTGSSWTFNKDAKELVEVRITVDYLTESSAQAMPVGSEDNIRQDDYHYILELGSTGKVLGGRYCADNATDHVDFFWSPTGRFNPNNPFVTSSKVKEILAKSFTQGGGTTTPGKVFTSTGSAVSIPDNNPTGASVAIPVTGLTGSPSLAVSVDITHTFRGDLRLELFKDGTKVKTLVDQAGGSAQNLVETFTVSAAEVGANPNVRWSLKVTDMAAQDVGTINSVKLEFSN
jgi:hypothetical protein